MKQISVEPKTALIVTGVVMLGILLIAKLPSVAEVVEGTSDMVGGVLSGNNAITEGARTDAYTGAGVIGTLGAATDRISGGVLSRFGEWLGGSIYDITH